MVKRIIQAVFYNNGYPFFHPMSGLKGGLTTGAIVGAYIIYMLTNHV